ncbi:uncharacterized protein LOC143298906 [Babylonia areolata]|uniref:uncharacterized protein LOC143298906 n=1 Tax=Babylonia areolata TaxID=304850 RepID=UPI003FD5C3B3
MPGPGPQWTDFLSCEVCYKLFSEHANRPISLGCGHTVCKLCLSRLQQNKCPFDQSPITCDIDKLPVNYALLQLIGAAIPDKVIDEEEPVGDISDAKKTECYESARKCIEELAVYLKPLSEDSINELEQNEDPIDLKVKSQSLTHTVRTALTNSSHNTGCVLSRPMQRKLLVLINCQLVEEEGRSRAARAARSLGDRSVTELILAHQNPQQLSANLWAAVRTRGCQFLGPGMQEEVLRLILLALEDGSALSRKVLVLFVVQRLEKQYPQASKTAIGHVVQLLYRASCFKVTKREEESSLMQLKEEFRTYETLRLEHDAQIVQIAMEAGLRISPEQWSSLLYGDATHKSHMQSIIDKHQSPQSFSQGISELVLVLQRLGDPSNLCRLRPHLDFLAKIDPSPECPAPSWEDMEVVMKSLKIVVQGLVDFLLHFNHRRPELVLPQNTRYKTSMCRDFNTKGSCPRGATCTFAHSQEELEQYRCRSKKLSLRGAVGMSIPMTSHLKQKPDQASTQPAPNVTTSTADHAEGDVAQSSDSNVGNLTNPMSHLSVTPSPRPSSLPHSHSSPSAPHFPPTHMVPPIPTSIPPVLPAMQQNMNQPQGGIRMPYAPVPGFTEGIHGGGMRFHRPSDLGVRYHNPNVSSQLPPHPMTGLPHHNLPTNPSAPAVGGGGPRMGEMVPPRAPPCPHQMSTEGMPPVYSMGMMMGQPMPTAFPSEAAYLLGRQGELHPPPVAGTPMPAMQSLEKLQNRKSELISHLQNERGVVSVGASMAHSSLDQVLATRPRPGMDVLNSSLNDTFVAMRTTNTLDDLVDPAKGEYLSNNSTMFGSRASPMSAKGVMMNEMFGAGSRVVLQPSHSPSASVSMAPPPADLVPATVRAQVLERAQAQSTASCDLTEDGESRDTEVFNQEILRLVTSTLENEDDFFIPFDPPLVSKFGPISRNVRVKVNNTDPVQVTAEEYSVKCTPVLAVTPLERPYPTSAPVPSLFKPQISACPAPPISLPPALPTPPTSIYSPWSGQDFWRWKIPEMVHNLEKSAIQANTTSERLALQLQSVELQISMKTGANPKPVIQLLQEAGPTTSEPVHITKQAMGRMYTTGEERNCVPQRSKFPPEWK